MGKSRWGLEGGWRNQMARRLGKLMRQVVGVCRYVCDQPNMSEKM